MIPLNTPRNPIHPSVLPRLDKQYASFYNANMADAPMVQELKWDPAIRTKPAVPGGAASLPVADIQDINLGDFSIRVFFPFSSQPPPVFIWYHGGGMVLGGISAENAFCTRVCVSAGCIVVAVDYRLAPEYKFPIGGDDSWLAYKWVVENSQTKLRSDGRIGIGGSSSGGNLAIMVSQKAGLAGLRVDFMAVTVPVCDNTASPETYKSWDVNRYCPGLPEAKMLWYRHQYLPNQADWSDPSASPYLAPDVAYQNSVPKVFIALAELDLLRSEGEKFGEKLRSFGKDVKIVTYPGVPHAVQAMDGVLDMSRRLITDLCTEIAVNFGKHPADVHLIDLYPTGAEIGVEQINGGSPWVKLDPPMVLGEAPLYRDSDSTLHYVDCLQQPAELHILQLDPAGDPIGTPIVHQLADSVTVACFRENKPGYICAYYQGVAFMDEAGNLEIVKEIIPTNQRDILRFNDGGVDCQGRFWLAEIDRKALAMGAGKAPIDYKPIGRLWRYDPDGSLHLMESGLICGNGLAWSPDNKTMYLNDSAAGLIYAYDFDIPTGNISRKRLFVDRRPLGGEPDGMVCDIEGNLWIAMWGSYCVMCYDASGRHVKDVRFTAKNMACTAWGGKDYDTLYIASASDNSTSRRSDDDGGHLFKFPVGVKGLPKPILTYPHAMLVRDIKERNTASTSATSQPPAPPSQQIGSFPPVLHRSQRPPKAPSAFALARQNEKARAAGHRPLGQGTLVESIPQVVTEQAESSSSVESAANERRVASMTPEERAQEVEEIKERFGDGVVDLMRKRRERRIRRSAPSLTSTARLPTEIDSDIVSESNETTIEETDKKPQQPGSQILLQGGNTQQHVSAEIDVTPSALHQSSEPSEAAKLEWLLPTVSSSTDETRYDLSGQALSPAAMTSLPSHLGLHHHGSSPDLAGYTLQEIYHLCRSTVTSQRITMMGVLAKICSRSHGNERQKGVELGVEVLQGSLKSLGLVRAAVELLFHSLGGDSWEDDDTRFLLSDPLPIPIDDLCQPLTDILSMDGGISTNTTRQLVLIIRRASVSSEELAEVICPLVPIVVRHHVLRQTWPSTSTSPSIDALRLLTSITLSSRTCSEALLSQNVYEPLLKFVIPTGHALTELERELAAEVMRCYAALGRYGLFSSVATSPVWRQFGSWAADQWANSDYNILLSAYLNCLRIWTVCAIDPHRTTPEHDLTWAQVVALGWHDEALSAIATVISQPAPLESPVLSSAIGVLVSWIEGSTINGVRGGEEEKAQVMTALKSNLGSLANLPPSPVELNLAALVQLHNRLGHLLDPRFIAKIQDFVDNLSTPTSRIISYELLHGDDRLRSLRLLYDLQPGEEMLALDLVDQLLRSNQTSVSKHTIDHKDGLQLLRPLLHHAILPDISHVVAPTTPSPLYLKVTSTQRSSDSEGLPLPPDWVFSPLNELLQSGSSAAFAQAPKDWDVSETDIVRATLILAQVVLQTSPVSRSSVLFNLMKVYMLEHGQSPNNTSESDIFRDPTVASLVQDLLALQQPEQSPSTPAPLEKISTDFLGEGVPFYQFYVDFLALYEAISFSDPSFGKLLLPPLAQTYPADYRKLLWSEQSTALRSLRFKMSDAPLEQGTIQTFFEPREADSDVLAGYTRALIRKWVTEDNSEFLYRIAVHHLAVLFWSDEEHDARVNLMVAVLSSAPNAVIKAIFEHQMPKGSEGAELEKRRTIIERSTGSKGLQRLAAI